MFNSKTLEQKRNNQQPDTENLMIHIVHIVLDTLQNIILLFIFTTT